VVNATSFNMLIDFKADDASLCQRKVAVTYEVVNGNQELWNTKMEKADTMTSADLAAIPKIIAAIKRAAKDI
jgi:hypothetical protein